MPESQPLSLRYKLPLIALRFGVSRLISSLT